MSELRGSELVVRRPKPDPGRGDCPAEVRKIGVRLLELDFGALDSELLYSMMLATLGVDIFLNRVPRLEPVAANQALVDFEKAARAAIQFLRYRARIPHVELLPYPLPLITLTRFFHCFPAVHFRSRELLSRWVWRGVLTGEHRGNRTSQRATLDAIHPEDEHGSVQRMLTLVRPWDQHDTPDLQHFRANGANAKCLILALWSLGPRHLCTGEPITIANDARNVFPPAVVTCSLRPSFFSNRMIHPPIEDHTLLQIILDTRDSEVLASHGLDAEMVEALRGRHYHRFRALRERYLVKVVDDFVLARTL